MKTLNVKVSKSTASKNGGFILTLMAFDVVKGAFGGTRTIERKLFIKSDVDVPVNTEHQLDLNLFNVVTVVDTYEGREVSKTWLKEKSSLTAISEVATRIDARETVVKSSVNF